MARTEAGSSMGSARLTLIGATLVLGLLVTGGLVWHGHVTSMPAAVAAWQRGAVSVTPLQTGAARLLITGMTPGADREHCATVHYTGGAGAAVRLYGSNYDPADARVRLTITSGSGPSCSAFGEAVTVYSGTVADFAATRTAYGTGVGTWRPGSGETSHPYGFTYEAEAASPSPAQVDFVWEARSDDVVS
ncbi:hypothetical protein J2S43_005021 [Catenuloplanes nepalensis]|uniref:Secreted protein n=1 Tax=Catenuloplanes nepalensis TaxID=587533 RepID=A0ABT9MYI2_9ACTN|nr:hypothetical protein [Catenuloplanes nepalensis]MDP9796509.1 hypothetical protein [Catenuloplanes nepalensis]